MVGFGIGGRRLPELLERFFVSGRSSGMKVIPTGIISPFRLRSLQARVADLYEKTGALHARSLVKRDVTHRPLSGNP